MGGFATGGQGFFSDPFGSIGSTLKEAWTGSLSEIDKANILSNSSDAIAIASGGNDPATIASTQLAAAADINAALDSFSVAGDSGGAQPTNDLRLPGGFTLSPATLEWIGIGIAVIIFGAVAFPYLAPLVVANVKAGKSVKAA
jgi:hypothetical protein